MDTSHPQTSDSTLPDQYESNMSFFSTGDLKFNAYDELYNTSPYGGMGTLDTLTINATKLNSPNPDISFPPNGHSFSTPDRSPTAYSPISASTGPSSRPFTPLESRNISMTSPANSEMETDMIMDGVGVTSSRDGGRSPTASSPSPSHIGRIQRYNPMVTSKGGPHSINQRNPNQIKSEERSRDKLREGYAKLMDTLPSSSQKSSKANMLDRAVAYIRELEASQSTLQSELDTKESELNRLRSLNDQLLRVISDQRRALTLGTLTTVNTESSSPAGNTRNNASSSF